VSSATNTNTLRILVVENHADTLESLRLYLEDCGHQVSTALTLEQARRHLSHFDYDLVICDIGLPDGSGWQLLENRPEKGELFAVAMSGFGKNADNTRSRAAGFRYHLLKPFRAAELDKILAEAQAGNANG
jgi:DNA-binding response OmpR family regulator